MEKRVLGEEGNVARVEPLGFVKVGLAAVPLAFSPCNVSKRFRNLAAIGQNPTRLLKIAHRGFVILLTGVVVLTFGQDGLAQIWLKPESGFGCLPCLFPEGRRWLKIQ